METRRQNVFSRKSETLANKNVFDGLPFEAVFIVDEEFEVMPPQSSLSSEIEFLKSPDESNLSDKIFSESDESLATEVRDLNEEIKVAQHLTEKNVNCANDIGEEVIIVDSQEAHSSKVTWNQTCDWAAEKLCRPVRPPSSNSVLDHTVGDGSTESLPFVLSSNDVIKEIINSGLHSHINSDSIFKSKARALKLQQKELDLKQSLHRIEEKCNMKKNVSKTASGNNSENQLINCTNSSASKPSDSIQIKTCSSPVIEPWRRGERLTNNLTLSVDDSCECDLDDLKQCIIEASRTLIKTEKSLRVLGKLISSEVSVEKQEAAKHLKNFKYTVNTFRKTINGLDKTLLTRYAHLVPHLASELVCEPDLSRNNLCPKKSKESIIGNGSLVKKKYQQFEIISAAADIEVGERSDDSTSDDQNSDVFSSTSGVQNILPKKRRKNSNKDLSSKKVKTRIIHGNWYSGFR